VLRVFKLLDSVVLKVDNSAIVIPSHISQAVLQRTLTMLVGVEFPSLAMGDYWVEMDIHMTTPVPNTERHAESFN
jgi:hypothetical protein